MLLWISRRPCKERRDIETGRQIRRGSPEIGPACVSMPAAALPRWRRVSPAGNHIGRGAPRRSSPRGARGNPRLSQIRIRRAERESSRRPRAPTAAGRRAGIGKARRARATRSRSLATARIISPGPSPAARCRTRRPRLRRRGQASGERRR